MQKRIKNAFLRFTSIGQPVKRYIPDPIVRALLRDTNAYQKILKTRIADSRALMDETKGKVNLLWKIKR